MKSDVYLPVLCECFPYLDANDLASLTTIMRVETLRKKEVFISPGEFRPKVALIIRGMIRGYFINEFGEEKTVFLSSERLFVGAPEAAFKNMPTKYCFSAENESVLLVFDFDTLKNMGCHHPNISRLIYDALSEIVFILTQRLESLIDNSPQSRYEKLINDQPHFFQQAFHKHLANYLGISPVSLSRIIKRKIQSPKN